MEHSECVVHVYASILISIDQYGRIQLHKVFINNRVYVLEAGIWSTGRHYIIIILHMASLAITPQLMSMHDWQSIVYR